MDVLQIGSIVVSIYEYETKEENELSVKENQVVQIKEISDEWIYVMDIQSSKNQGFVPRSFLAPFKPVVDSGIYFFFSFKISSLFT